MHLPIVVAVTFSLVQSEGKEFSSGAVPVRGKRLARAVGFGRPGSKIEFSSLEGPQLPEALSGVTLELEPNIGANDHIIDFRYDFELGGKRVLRARSNATVQAGRPLYVPLGMSGGHSLGLIIEGQVVDGTGAWRHK